MLARDIMHQAVISIPQTATVHDAVRLMVARRISGLVVVDQHGKLVGMLTESDLLRRAEIGTEPHHSKLVACLRGPGREAEDYLRTHAQLVSDLMHSPVTAVSPDATLDEIVGAMEKHKVRRVPVVEKGVPVGIISRADLLRALEPMLAPDDEVRASTDQELEDAVIAELRAQPWVPPGLAVAARSAIVTISGVVSDPREERAVLVLVQSVPGVRGVRNELVYVDVNTGMTFSGMN